MYEKKNAIKRRKKRRKKNIHIYTYESQKLCMKFIFFFRRRENMIWEKERKQQVFDSWKPAEFHIGMCVVYYLIGLE